MKKSFFASVLVLALAWPAWADDVRHVVPTDRVNVAGTAGFLGPLSTAHRRYQLLIHENELTDLVGLPLTALTWRLLPGASADWPANDVTFSQYDIYLGQSVAPANRSLTFADNMVGPQTQVRSGPLSIPAGSFRAQGDPREFGMEITFDTPWTYMGDHLLIELRHMGHTGTSVSVDAMAATGGAAAGYGSRFSAAWAGSTTAVSGSQGNFAVVQLTAIPEPATGMILLSAVGLLTLRRRG